VNIKKKGEGIFKGIRLYQDGIQIVRCCEEYDELPGGKFIK
jgi:hypothetical protein